MQFYTQGVESTWNSKHVSRNPELRTIEFPADLFDGKLWDTESALCWVVMRVFNTPNNLVIYCLFKHFLKKKLGGFSSNAPRNQNPLWERKDNESSSWSKPLILPTSIWSPRFISLLSRGHEELWRSHGIMQSKWYECPHPAVKISSPRFMGSKHTQHSILLLASYFCIGNLRISLSNQCFKFKLSTKSILPFILPIEYTGSGGGSNITSNLYEHNFVNSIKDGNLPVH